MKKRAVFLALLLFLSSAQAQDLLSIYQIALQNDPKLKGAQATLLSAREARPQSIARLLPSISFSGNLENNYQSSNRTYFANTNKPLGFVNFLDSAATFSLRQPVYHHEFWVQLSQADSQIALAEATYANEEQSTLLRTAQAYFNILLSQDNLTFAKAEKQAVARQLDQAKARFEVGLSAITDVAQAQSGYDLAYANEIKAENDLDNAREAMREIIGEFDIHLKGLSEEIPMESPKPSDIEDWDKRAQQNNLGIIAARNRSELAQKSINLQFAGHLPTLDITASAGFSDNNRTLPENSSYRQQSGVFGMQLNMPIFQGGMVNSRVTQARHDFEAAQDNLDAQRRFVMKQVKTAYRGVMSSISQVAALKAAVASAQSAREATEAGFEVGTRNMVEVLTSQRDLFRAKRDYAKTRYDYIINNLSLKQGVNELNIEDVEQVNSWLKVN